MSQWKDTYDNIEATVFTNGTRQVTAAGIQLLLQNIWLKKDQFIYVTDRSYSANMICIYDAGSGPDLYVCTASTSGAFNSDKWKKLTTSYLFTGTIIEDPTETTTTKQLEVNIGGRTFRVNAIEIEE